MKKVIAALIVFLFFFSVNSSVFAAAKKPAAKSTSKDISVSYALRRDKKALIVNFGNLKNAKSVLYTLIYTTNGRQEGAGGSVKTSTNTARRELLFGTCSGKVCRYHTNISNMSLEINAKLKSGKQNFKKYSVKL